MTRIDDFRLDDRYRTEDGTVLLSGVQALVRLLVDQHRADRHHGQRTGVFVSGYQGSPLGTYDLTIRRERELMAEHDVRLVQGVNEELAATAVWGSQQDALGDLDARDGVVAVWYGKAPGVDRCGDVFKHGNLMGVSPNGGVLVLAGDDPVSKSSTFPSASEMALADAQVPVLAPGNPQEILDLGLHGVALSRFSGLWVGMKIVTNVADGFGTAVVSPTRVQPIAPPVEVDGAPWHYHQGGLPLPPRNLTDERDLVYGRLEAARAYARVNGLNEVTRSGGARARIGIVAAGKTYHDVVQALGELGLVGDQLDAAGIRLLRLGMIWPLEPESIRGFATGLDEIVVVEEKRDFIEQQVRAVLYSLDDRPRVVGKRDHEGRAFVPADGELTPDRLAGLLAARVPVPVEAQARGQLTVGAPARGSGTRIPVARAPYFCSGCPHNRSTLVPEGSVAGGGIGCHTMAAMMGRSSVSMTQMGGEGAQWIGRAGFTARPHMFQNLGDGTFFHSGSMAIRACVAAGVNITYKILYNSAVAMTGGQDAAGAIPVPALTRLLEADGVRRTIVCAEDPGHYGRSARFAANVDVWPRDRLDEAQRLLRDTPGVTAIVYDQECAAEKRRDRKRGRVAEPAMRVVINEAVCEGCGDCGVKSNCLSVQPVDTEFGRKTRIHQSSCNRDYTCLDGDCPSFLTVTETRRSRRRAAARADVKIRELPRAGDVAEPSDRATVDRLYSLYLTGVGGTGVVTVSQLLATAAVLDGVHVVGLDQTGLSQKGGPVVSHVKLAPAPIDESNTVGDGEADAYLGFDLLVAADGRHVARIRPGGVAVLSTSKVPTGSMVTDTTLEFPVVDSLVGTVSERTGGERDLHVDSLELAEGLFGDHMLANVLLLGAAYQLGAIPLSAASIEQAIELNGVAVEHNREAFRWGRRYVLDPAAVRSAAGTDDPDPAAPTAEEDPRSSRVAKRSAEVLASCTLDGELRRLVDIRVPELVAYQGVALARTYLADVERVREVEQAAQPDQTRVSEAYARYLFKLLAYKDEYEVARLSLRAGLPADVHEQAPNGGRVRYRIHPPVLRSLGMKRKLSLGPWFRVVFRGLYGMRRLRNTPFDPFGHTTIRRTERALPAEYRALVDAALIGLRGSDLAGDDYERAVQVAELPDLVRGYEDIKMGNVEQFRAEARRLLPVVGMK